MLLFLCGLNLHFLEVNGSEGAKKNKESWSQRSNYEPFATIFTIMISDNYTFSIRERKLGNIVLG